MSLLVSDVENTQYELIGLVEHQGISLKEGHYEAYAIHGDYWFKFDDNKPSHVKEAEVLETDPYILVYKRDKPSLESDPITQTPQVG